MDFFLLKCNALQTFLNNIARKYENLFRQTARLVFPNRIKREFENTRILIRELFVGVALKTVMIFVPQLYGNITDVLYEFKEFNVLIRRTYISQNVSCCRVS